MSMSLPVTASKDDCVVNISHQIFVSIFSFAIFFMATTASAGQAGSDPSVTPGQVSFAITLSEKKCQLAVWLTDSHGKFIDTVYVSRKTGQKGLGNRGGSLDDKWGGSRLSMLPVWAHQRGVDYGGGNFYPPKDKPLPDVVSSASPPAGRFNLLWHPAIVAGRGLLFLC